MLTDRSWYQKELERLEVQFRQLSQAAEASADRLFMQLAAEKSEDPDEQARRVRDYWTCRARSELAGRAADEFARVRCGVR